MTRYDLLLDPHRGTVTVLGRSGQTYSVETVDRAERAAARGDPHAAAVLADVDGDEGETFEDCPLCRAERERGATRDEVLFEDDTDVVFDALERWSRIYARRARRRGGG